MLNLNPKVSIIIPTYNRAELLVKTIESVINQTYNNIEIIIIDDCSTDNTEQVVRNLNSELITYYKLTQNMGAQAARNYGIEHSTGDLIAFLDSDDKWHPKKLEKQLVLFNNKKNPIGLVYTGILEVSSQDEKYIKPTKRGGITNSLVLSNCVGTTSSVVIKKELLLEVGNFDLSYPSCQDWDLYLRLSKITNFDFVDEPLVIYSDHEGDRISNNSKKVVEGQLKIHENYKDLVTSFSRYTIYTHYLNIGKNIIKAGILGNNDKYIRQGRLFLWNAIKILPYKINGYIFLLSTFISKNFLSSQYKLYKKIKASK